MRKVFTLSELLILSVCLGLAGATLIPGFYRARVSANEGSAVGTLRTISTSQA